MADAKTQIAIKRYNERSKEDLLRTEQQLILDRLPLMSRDTILSSQLIWNTNHGTIKYRENFERKFSAH